MFTEWSLGRKIAAVLALGPIALIAISVITLTSLLSGTDSQGAINTVIFGTIAAVAVLVIASLALIRSVNRPVYAANKGERSNDQYRDRSDRPENDGIDRPLTIRAGEQARERDHAYRNKRNRS